MDFLNNVGEASEEETHPEYFLTEADTAAQPVDEGEGVDDELGPGDVHHLVVHDEHLHPPCLGVGALVVGLVVEAGAGGGALAGLGGVEAGVKLEQEVEHRVPQLGGEGEGAALKYCLTVTGREQLDRPGLDPPQTTGEHTLSAPPSWTESLTPNSSHTPLRVWLFTP